MVRGLQERANLRVPDSAGQRSGRRDAVVFDTGVLLIFGGMAAQFAATF